MQKDDAIRQSLAAQAEMNGYPFPERLDKWVQRLSLNGPELEALKEMPVKDEAPYHPVSVSPDWNRADFAEQFNGFQDIKGRFSAEDPVSKSRIRIGELKKNMDSISQLNAFINFDDSLTRDGDIDTGSVQGPLSGITIGVKDLMNVKGIPLTGGSRALDPVVPDEDADCVKRLRQAGALIAGTTNLHELAFGITSENPHFGTVGNPAIPGRIAGGSSGGSAAAVAAGFIDAAVGTDTAGSIRIPSACCGVVGFKPSYGAISTDGILPLGRSLDHAGPITRNVDDAALMTSLMLSSVNERPQGESAPLTWTVVRPENFFLDYLEPSVRNCFESVVKKLLSAGIQVVERTVPYVEYAAAIQFMILCVEATERYFPVLLNSPEGLGEDVRVRLEIGQFFPAVDFQRAQRLRGILRSNMIDSLAGADAYILPALPIGAPPVGCTTVDIDGFNAPVHSMLTRCTAPFNLSGMPAITLPCGKNNEGAPIGLQIAGRPGADLSVLRLAKQIEGELKGSY